MDLFYLRLKIFHRLETLRRCNFLHPMTKSGRMDEKDGEKTLQSAVHKNNPKFIECTVPILG